MALQEPSDEGRNCCFKDAGAIIAAETMHFTWGARQNGRSRIHHALVVPKRASPKNLYGWLTMSAYLGHAVFPRCSVTACLFEKSSKEVRRKASPKRFKKCLKQRSRKLSLRAPKRAPRWDGQPVLDNGATLVGHCSVIHPAGPLAR